tara:strand:- start:236 stop:721 length:486 start_codon:yes stop_codon:yes gene_type:complete
MEILRRIEKELLNNQFRIISKDLDRPWGGFFVLDQIQSKKFINFYFNKSTFELIDFSLKISPKILVIKPNKRLSWQYHNRRSEIWSVIKGDILVSRSQNDNEGSLIQLKKGEQIEITNKIRHRIIGTEDYALVAEIWMHSNKNIPSDENDIVRLQDDFNRN